MPTENEVLETKKKRFSVLNIIYDFAGQSEQQPINTNEIKNKTKIEGKELYNILKFLVNHGLIKKRSSLESMWGMGGSAIVTITHKGLCEVEEAIENPNKPTENFPANIFYTYTTIEGNNSCHTIGAIMNEMNLDQKYSSIGVGGNQGEINTKNLAGTINEAEKKNLAEAAAEIRQLLEQLSQNYPTHTTAQKMVVAAEAIERIENDPIWKQRAINAAKEGGLAALEKAIDNPVGAFVVGAVKGWQETEVQ
jgi:DNA-binding IscR family transcriptional regulator